MKRISFLVLASLVVPIACGRSSADPGSSDAQKSADSGAESSSSLLDGGPDIGFPDPAKVGFHHAALIYQRDQDRTAQTFAPYVTWQQDGHPRDGQWLFDAYVFLAFQAPSGADLAYGASTKSDWEALLDGWFGGAARRGEVGTLEDALSSTAQTSTEQGKPMGAPPTPRHAVIAMPWMNPQLTDFGDVDGDGKSEDLSRTDDRVKVARWYAGKVRDRFAAQHYANVDLWGLYFMREDIVRQDEISLPQVAAAVHAAGLRMMWIPYYAAPGRDEWQPLGFDVAILQPSYAFRSWLDGGRVTRSRLHAAADFARNKGLGVEVEVRGTGELAAERRMLQGYLADGARFGYQQAATAYFLGGDVIEQAFSPSGAVADPNAYGVYQAIAGYVRGDAVADPDPDISFATNTSADGKTTTAHAQLAPALDLHGVRIELDESNPGSWSGTASVRARRSGASQWESSGWAAYASPDRAGGPTRWQTLTVPVPSAGLPPVEELEVSLTTADTSAAALPSFHIVPDTDLAPESDASLARVQATRSPRPRRRRHTPTARRPG